MSFSLFLKKSGYVLGAMILLLLIATVANLFSFPLAPVWVALGIAYLNFIIGVAVLAWGFGKEDKQFYGAFFGGMLFRFVLMFAVLWLLIKLFHYPMFVLILALIFFYFSFLVVEILGIVQSSSLRGVQNDAR
ncbi:MAG: hypothetical protein Kow0037_04980 [Calditrichia bacterium]